MKIQTQQLIPHLTKNIAPLYLVSGDDFVLVQEACDTIRKHAATAGYTEREVFYIESGFNWENFLSSATNSSLFGSQVLIELHLKSKLTDSGSKVLQNYAQKPTPDKIILIIIREAKKRTFPQMLNLSYVLVKSPSCLPIILFIFVI